MLNLNMAFNDPAAKLGVKTASIVKSSYILIFNNNIVLYIPNIFLVVVGSLKCLVKVVMVVLFWLFYDDTVIASVPVLVLSTNQRDMGIFFNVGTR